MRILVTRPIEDARRTARVLEDLGHRVTIEPMLAIVPRPAPPPDWRGVQAVLATSANGVRALAALDARRDLPLLAVGDSSARAARELGYCRVESAAGDVADLARLVAAELSPADGALVHAAAGTMAGDLGKSLAGLGFEVRKLHLYDAVLPEALSPALVRALETAGLDAALFFSPRSARTFVTLAGRAGVTGTLARLFAYALSGAVAERLRVAPWRAIRVAGHPTQESLLRVLAAEAADENGGGES